MLISCINRVLQFKANRDRSVNNISSLQHIPDYSQEFGPKGYYPFQVSAAVIDYNLWALIVLSLPTVPKIP